jgi:hypothetical protein
MRVNCTNCPAQLELGARGKDIGDTAYKHIYAPSYESTLPKGDDMTSILTAPTCAA